VGPSLVRGRVGAGTHIQPWIFFASKFAERTSLQLLAVAPGNLSLGLPVVHGSDLQDRKTSFAAEGFHRRQDTGPQAFCKYFSASDNDLCHRDIVDVSNFPVPQFRSRTKLDHIPSSRFILLPRSALWPSQEDARGKG